MHKSNGILTNQSPRKKRPLNTLIKKCWLVLATLIILAALISSLFRALTPWASEYKGEVERHLSTLLGQPVSIKTMETGWYWFAPVIKLQSVSILDNQNKPIFLDKVLVGFNLLGSVLHWKIQPGILYIDQVHLVLREKEGLWVLDGFSHQSGEMNKISPALTQPILVWLSQQDKLIVKNISANIYSSQGDVLPIRDVNFILSRTGKHYRLRGKAYLAQPSILTSKSTSFRLMADIDLDINKLNEIKGQIYLSSNNVLLMQGKSFFPETLQQVEAGEGDVDLWIDIVKSKPSMVQSKVNISNFIYNNQKIDSFKGNLAWEPKEHGWNISADQLELQIADKAWSENKFFLHYEQNSDSYLLFVKSLVLEDVLALNVDWFKKIPFLVNNKIQGQLSELQIKTQHNQIVSALARFDQLSWQKFQKIPGVENISGVLQYKSNEGRLELDSENSHLFIEGYPTQHFSIINAALAWKLLDTGLYRFNVERLELNQPDLALSVIGVLDDVSASTLGYLQITMDFSARHLEKFIQYLPLKEVKPKLDAWLKNNIKHIANASGRIKFNGIASDFPFDNTPGEFTINSYFSGVDLLINREWPLITKADGYFNGNKRSLQVDLTQASFQDMTVHNMQLHIDDIGKDKETLIMDTKIQDQAKNMLNFALNSPIGQKITILKKISVQGLLSVILHLEIPLYPEKDDITLNGNLNFDKNTIIFKNPFGKLKLDDINGGLIFTDQGLKPSVLHASFLGSFLDISAASKHSTKHQTVVRINSDMNIENLKNYFHSPVFSLFNGRLITETDLVIDSASNNLDVIQLKSSLQGTAIVLPPPLGKIPNTIVPLNAQVGFKNNDRIQVKVHYGDVLRSNLMFDMHANALKLNSGTVRIGKTHATLENLPGLQIVGTLNVFDLKQWQNVASVFSSEDDNTEWLKSINYVDFFIEKLIAFKQTINQIALKVSPGKKGDLKFNIKQKDVLADLIYNFKVNQLSGHFSRLNLSKSEFSKELGTTDTLNVSPGQIPNLNLRIDGLEYGDLKIGDITMNTQSSKSLLKLTYCKIQSPGYTMNIQGNWNKENGENKTDIEVALVFNNLAKTLEHWAITPAVDATKGEAKFIGGWSGPIYGFSLPKVNGQLFLMLNHGRITDLSPEMEQKLGLGKLLSILSLQTIPRRLTLDFSDLSEKGYSFDTFKGNFTIKEGIMHTEDSFIDGPVAYASMKGELDLVKRLYDLELGIAPHVTASLPIVATIAGGPVVGAAAWVVGKIINKGMQKISAYTYKISGPWSDPVVQQISIIKKKM